MINLLYLQEVSAINAEIIPNPSCVVSFGSHLDCVMPGVQVTTGLGFFLP